MTAEAAMSAVPNRRPADGFDISLWVKMVIATVGTGLIVISLAAVMKAVLGLVPTPAGAKTAAVMIHLTAVLPAIPLGLYLLIARKGGPRHRMLGKLWLTLMIVTAASAIFIRHINGGQFSFIHLFVPLTFAGAWRVIATARRGDLAAHRRHLVGFYLGAMVLPGLFSFIPGRLMAHWLLG